MAIPYTTAEADELGTHVHRKDGNTWRYVEDVYKHVGADGWKDVKEVWYKSGGTWRLVHEGEHFLFKTTLSTNAENQWSLSTYITGQGYTGNKIKGVVVVNNAQQRVNLNNYQNGSRILLVVNSGKKISGRGGNGGNASGGNGQNGQRALYSGGTPFKLNNAGVIAGGGGGGGAGNHGQCSYQTTQYVSCMKGQQCAQQQTQYSQSGGGGGGGGAGFPGGSGGTCPNTNPQGGNGSGGSQTAGGGPGSAGGCGGATGGGKGGNLGQDGQNSGGNGGTKGWGIQGVNHKYGTYGSGDGDIRGGTTNT